MAEKIAQTMVTLAEDNRDVKISLRLLLKYEIQSLLERLSALGDDSLLILTNTNEGTCSHLGTRNADNFLDYLKSNVPLNLKGAFQKFCSNSAGIGGQLDGSQMQQDTGDNSLQNNPGNQSMPQMPNQLQNHPGNQPMPQLPNQLQKHSRNQTMAQFASQLHNLSRNQTIPQLPLFNIQSQLNTLNSLITGPQQPVTSQLSTRFSPYMNLHVSSLQNFSGNHTTEKAKDSNTALPQTVLERKKRNACRHFVSKGYCWQGNTCAFLHTRDPQILDTFGSTLKKSEDSNQTPSSSSVDSSGQSGKDPV